MAFWIVEKRDDAILGFVRGVKGQDLMAGPFDSFDEADAVRKSEYHGSRCYYYVVVESDTKPVSEKSMYEFTEAHWEFDDV